MRQHYLERSLAYMKNGSSTKNADVRCHNNTFLPKTGNSISTDFDKHSLNFFPVPPFQQERKESQKRMVGGAFKLNMHPRALFKENPYKADKSESGCFSF